MKKLLILLLALGALLTIALETSTCVMAEPHGYRGGWHGREHMWRGGNWFHGWYGGRFGWYWFVPGFGYYPYAAPVYPAPDPYGAPPVLEVLPNTPAPVPVPPSVTSAPQEAPAAVWYYCEASKTYYPYVNECPSGWKTVPAKPQ